MNDETQTQDDVDWTDEELNILRIIDETGGADIRPEQNDLMWKLVEQGYAYPGDGDMFLTQAGRDALD